MYFQLKQKSGKALEKDIHTQSNEEIEDKIIELEVKLEKDPTSIEILLEISSCLRHLDRYSEAIMIHDRILEIDSSNLDYLFMKGLVLFESSKYEEAILCFDEILKHVKNHRDALFNKGLALKSMGKTSEAKQYMKKALR